MVDGSSNYFNLSLKTLASGSEESKNSTVVEATKTGITELGMELEEQLSDPDDSVKGKGGRKKSTWSPSMDRILIDTLTEQLQLGFRKDTGWKRCAFEKVTNQIEQKLGIVITIGNVRSRVKLWRSHYFSVKECLAHNGFTWDDTLKMVNAPSDVWDEYLKTHKKAAICRTKHFVNWDEVVPLIDFDHPSRIRESAPRLTNTETNTIAAKRLFTSQNIEDVVEEDVEDDLSGDTPRSTPSPAYSMARGGINSLKKKRVHKDEPTISSSLGSIAESMKIIAQAMVERTRRVDANELLSELKRVPDISIMLILEAAEYLLADFHRASLFYALSMEERKIWLMRRFPQHVVDGYA